MLLYTDSYHILSTNGRYTRLLYMASYIPSTNRGDRNGRRRKSIDPIQTEEKSTLYVPKEGKSRDRVVEGTGCY